jgi:uncharacterized protein (DUF1501 family)
MRLTRREVLASLAATSLLAFSGGFARLAFAESPFSDERGDQRFILVILRGALDGLAFAPPYGDRDYRTIRRSLALDPPHQAEGALDLDGFYGLNPGLDALLPLYRKEQLALIHAVATPYRERSHFDAQNLLENGTDAPAGTEGWLNRALIAAQARPSSAIAISQQIPLVLQGAAKVISWAPKGREIDAQSDYMTKIARLYQSDPMLSSSFAEAMQAQQIAVQSLSPEDRAASKGAKGVGELAIAAKAAALFLSKPEGPRIAVLEAGGWDTHARQGTHSGALFDRLGGLGKAIALLPEALGDAWQKTILAVVTEFGRTAAPNGTGGTDHGTGSAMLLAGGALRGGKVYGRWPGLAERQLYQGRDLMPTTDMRSVFKTILYAHLKIPREPLENAVFPGSGEAELMTGLMG